MERTERFRGRVYDMISSSTVGRDGRGISGSAYGHVRGAYVCEGKAAVAAAADENRLGRSFVIDGRDVRV